MKNKNILKQIYNLISTVNDFYINIFIEEIYENQIELHLKNQKIKKINVDYGVRVIIKNNEETKYKTLSFPNYDEMYYWIVDYIQEATNKNLVLKKGKVTFKKINNKNIKLSKQKKYKIMSEIIENLTGYDKLKVSFYEKKENTFIIQNNSSYILNVKNFYTKIMIKGNIQDIDVFDFILSDHGYKNIDKIKICNLIKQFKEISHIKTNKINISDANYDIILSNNCGTIFHEMLGHNLELDLINKNNSKLFKKNNFIGNNLITFIDDSINQSLLNIRYDDFMNKNNNKILIDDGIVKQYITTLRSESYKFFPATRMTNSYLCPNKDALPFYLKKVKNGIYVYKIGSGRLYLEKQKFKITIDVGFLIKDGSISGCVSDLSFEVDVPTFIKKIKYVGNDLKFVPTICGASSGNIFAYAGTPTVYVENVFIEQL